MNINKKQWIGKILIKTKYDNPIDWKNSLVGPPMLTTNKGFGRGANTSCHALAALRNAAKSI